MTNSTRQQKTAAMWGVFGVGALLLIIAIVVDPIGFSPDTGMIDLDPIGTRWLLGGLGALFILAGAYKIVRNRLRGENQIIN